MLKLAIGVPAYRGTVCSGHVPMWTQFGAACARVPDEVSVVMLGHVDTCGVDRARNALVRQASKAGADWLLMVDSDTFAVHGKDLLRMVLDRPVDAAVVGAPVIRRGGAAEPNVWAWDETADRHVACHWQSSAMSYAAVDAVGAAILALNLTTAARVGAVFAWVEGMSEDLWFCRQIRRACESIYVDRRVATVHLGQPEILSYSPPFPIAR